MTMKPKFSSQTFVVLILAIPLTSSAQKCTISQQDQSNVAKLSAGNLNFALNIYKSLAKNSNLFFSPFSISVALAMTAAGAGGNTLTQMKNVINLNGFANENQINQAFSSVLGSICSNSNYTLSTANKIFLQKNYPVLQQYLNTLANFYQASAENVDFQSNADGVAKEINAWVEQQTNNTIKNLFPPGSLSPATILVLVNAIYFKGTWIKRFNSNETKPEVFTLSNGQTVSVPMMNIEETFNYAYSVPLNSKILQLNYAGDRLVMYAILPNQNNGLAQLQQQLTPDAFNSLRQQLFSTKVIVKFPKFKLNFRKQLNEILAALGMSDIFNPSSSNLTGISDPKNGNLYVSSVIHQAFIEVDEQGTTAAAATAVSILKALAVVGPPPPPITFYADHPFIFVIYDTKTNLILFMGNVDNPNA